jgi:hypothetical protein
MGSCRRRFSSVRTAWTFSCHLLRIVWRNTVNHLAGYPTYPREMIAGIRDNGLLDWLRLLVVEERNEVTSALSSLRLDSTGPSPSSSDPGRVL